MAFLTQLTTQTEELVTAIAASSPKNDPQAFSALREATLRSLRHHSFGRTNQFEIESRLDGLEERFAVAGRDGLADGLRQRRLLLADHATKWTPDILDFLLELSENPVEQASLDELNDLCASRHTLELPSLRWEDIAREDDWGSEPTLWQNTDYGDTSGDDYDRDDDRDDDENTSETTISSIRTQEQQQQQQQRASRVFVSEGQSREELSALLQAVRQSQSWRTGQMTARSVSGPNADGGEVPISELQMIRETLFMLQGLETTLFGADCTSASIYRLSDVSYDAHKSLVSWVAAVGRKLLPLRRFVDCKRQENICVPLLQVFEESIRRRLHAFDQELSQVQARFVCIRNDVIVSLVAIMDELQPSLSCLLALSAVVQKLGSERNAHGFRYLELLFDAASAAQMEGNQRLYSFLGTIFFECFRVYLRPIRLWMEEGKLLDGDKTFFVASAPKQMPLNQIWQHQYKLLRTSNGILHAPKFLQPAASRIFTTGKSIVILKHLGKYGDPRQGSAVIVPAAEPMLDFATICPPETGMAPFAHLFTDAFERWIQSKHHAASATLQATLFDSCGLWASLQALHCVYLMSDGAMVDAFVSPVFQSLDSKSPKWLDRYTMTELAREAFGSRLDSYRLSAQVEKDKGTPGSSGLDSQNEPAVARRSVRNGMARVRLSYQLAWPVQIVIPPECLADYQALFTLLLQVRRASSLLSRHRLLDDGHDVRGYLGGEAASASASAKAIATATAATAREAESRLPTGDRALYFTLRAKLLWFCQTLQSYLATLVIAPRIESLQSNLQKAVDVDAMISVHTNFLRALGDEACLGSKLQPIHDCMLDLLDLAIRLEDARRANAEREANELQETWRLSVLSSPFQTPLKKLAVNEGTTTSSGSVSRRLFFATPKHKENEDEEHEEEEYAEEEEEEGEDGDEDDGYNSDDDIVDTRGSPGGRRAPSGRAPIIPVTNKRKRRMGTSNGHLDHGDSSGTAMKQSYSEVLRSISTEFSSYLRFVTGGLRGVARASSDATAAAKWDILAEMLGDGSIGHAKRSSRY